ncbi:MAG: hypothetical protein ABDI20_01980 [Candidatus Bipolaricaulaceae bacterium]
MRRTSLVVLAAVVLASWAQEVPPGYDAASFARIGVGVGSLGMGGAVVAAAAGPAAAYWNPAGLADWEAFAVEGMYTNWMGADVHYQYLLLAGMPPLGPERPRPVFLGVPLTLGLGWISVVVPNIPYVDEAGNRGTFSASSHLVLAALGFPSPRWPGLALGTALKFYHDRILEGMSLGLGFDFGLRWQGEVAGLPLALALATTDIGDSQIRWFGTQGQPVNYVPWLMRVGAAVRLWEGRLLVGAGYEWGLRRPRFERLRLGAELSLAWVSLRAGYDWLLVEPQGRWRAGLGLKPLEWMALDYAFVPAALGDSHLLAFRVQF